MKELQKNYDPTRVESDIYEKWENAGCFRGTADPKKKAYSIAMPPPNVTGQLHMGHAVDNTWQDILIRFKRMQGYSALWIPGTDHAAIATEAKIVEEMRKEGLSKADLGRDKFMERAWAWKAKYGGTIVKQLRKLGSSCDWEREHFTMDEQCSKAVLEVFVNLYEKGLIYRGNRMVNWCTKCRTSISDAEVEYEPQAGHFWHILYKVKETGEFLEIATTRPETMLGDTAVAINAEDPRYAHLHGCHVILPIAEREIPIVCDEHADMEKGTGVVKITPAHDPNDFEVGLRHNLPMIRCFTYDGFMTGADDVAEYNELKESGRLTQDEPEVYDCGKYAGMTTEDARKIIVEDLQNQGLLKEVEDISHDVGACYRCHQTIEPMVSKQWFVKMKTLAEPAVQAALDGEIKFVPERFTKNYLNWMKNTRDWCISRQLWWGHRIPAWYCGDCGETNVAKQAPCTCKKCGGSNLSQDPDSLDTWFSSALWPFSILGWPDNTAEDYNYFYPTSTLVTGYDIIGFWVSRMIFSGLAYTGSLPFSTVVIHGIVRDSQGRKMSKSLGNGIDPLKVIEEYGADALRFMLIQGSSPGNDMRYSEEKILAMRNFNNKIWNASRFLLMGMTIDKIELPENLTLEDKWILSKLNHLISEVTYNLEAFDMGVAAQKVYDFIWDSFCDWYIELAKNRFNGNDLDKKRDVENVLAYVLTDILKLLHPFMPFITEEIYQALPHEEGYLMTRSWPVYREDLNFPKDEERMEKIMNFVRAVRECRAEHKVPNKRKTHITVVAADYEQFTEAKDFLIRLAGASDVSFVSEETEETANMVTVATADAKLCLPLRELVDVESEKVRIKKELEKAYKELDFVNGKLNNEKFMSKAPQKLIDDIKEKETKVNALIKNLTDMLKSLES